MRGFAFAGRCLALETAGEGVGEYNKHHRVLFHKEREAEEKATADERNPASMIPGLSQDQKSGRNEENYEVIRVRGEAGDGEARGQQRERRSGGECREVGKRSIADYGTG